MRVRGWTCLFLILFLASSGGACQSAQTNSISSSPVTSSTITSEISSVPTSTAIASTQTSPVSPAILLIDWPCDSQGNWVGLNLVITFSVPMDETTTAGAVALSPGISHIISWENSSSRMVIHPLVNWALTIYKLTIVDDAKSTIGARMDKDYSAEFEIKNRPPPPVVVSTDPPNKKEEVYPEAVIRILFSKPMDTEATEASLVIIPNTDLSQGYAIVWDQNNRRLSFYFAQNMRPGELYRITVTATALSADGAYMERSYIFIFDVMSC